MSLPAVQLEPRAPLVSSSSIFSLFSSSTNSFASQWLGCLLPLGWLSCALQLGEALKSAPEALSSRTVAPERREKKEIRQLRAYFQLPAPLIAGCGGARASLHLIRIKSDFCNCH